MSENPEEHIDELTGLFKWHSYGRVKLEEAICEAHNIKGTVSIVLADIDGMLPFNDEYGLCFGEAVISKWAHIIQCIAGEPNIACRIGGEEFVIIMPAASLETAKTLAEEIRSKASQTSVELNGQQSPPLTITLGVANFPIHGQDVDSLLIAVDEAMYQGKMSGRSCVIS